MAVAHGKSASFKLDDSGGSVVDLSAYVRKVTFSPDIAIHMVTTLGMNSQAKITGLKDAKMSIEFVNDPTLQTHLIGIYGLGSSSSVAYSPQGTTSGFRKITCEAWLTGFPIEADVSKEESITATFDVTGDVTFTTN